jgi:hypothetical protein
LPLLKEENKLVADIGPIKYVADMFFEGDSAVDKAVRMVILLIMLVFDPLAVLLLIAGNISLKEKQEQVPEEITVQDGTITKINFATVPKKSDSVEIEKENLATIEPLLGEQETTQTIHDENKNEVPVQKDIVIDPVSGESIPPIEVHHSPGVYEEHHDVTPELVKKLEPKYDYDNEFAFAEKKKKQEFDGGNF